MGNWADNAIARSAAGQGTAPWSGLADAVTDRLARADSALAVLPQVLEHVAAAFGADRAIALRPATALPLAWHADQGAEAAGVTETAPGDAALLGEIRALCPIHRDAAGPGGSFSGHVGAGERRRPLTVVYSGTVAGELRCAIAVIGAMTDWPPDARLALRTCATVLAARLHQDQSAGAGRELCAAAPVAIVAVDQGGRIREFNRAAETLFGHHRADVIGLDMPALLVPRRHRSLVREAMAAHLATGDESVFGASITLRGRLADGSERPVDLVPLAIRVGSVTYFCGFVDPAAGRDGMPAPETDVRFGMLSELAPVGIVQAGPDGRITFVNGRWCKLTGLGADDALGRTWLASIHPDDVAVVRPNLAVALDTGSELRADCRLRSVDGRETWVHAAVRPIIGPSGACTGQLAAFTNVDARKRAESELESARAQLAEQNSELRNLDTAKTQFLATVSHELRSPLTSIVSFTQLLKDEVGPASELGRDYLDIVQRNAERLLRLVSDLLYLDRLDDGGISLDLEAVQPSEVAADSVRLAGAAAAEAGVDLSLACDDGPPVRGDRLRLQQVLDNLISNAIKFTPDGGDVEVRAGWDARDWTLSVGDTGMGIGIPADEAGRLFERFFRASNAVSGQVPGTGLGLATAKAITELHGGTIAVQSSPRQGTTISVRLPAGS